MLPPTASGADGRAAELDDEPPVAAVIRARRDSPDAFDQSREHALSRLSSGARHPTDASSDPQVGADSTDVVERRACQPAASDSSAGTLNMPRAESPSSRGAI